MNETRFELIDHPSDLGILVHRGNYKETFENAAYGMFSSMAELSDIKAGESFEINVKGDDREELFINWLNELIFIWDSKKVLLKDFQIRSLTDKTLKAHVAGEKIQADLHELHRPIKAATYNQLELNEKRAKVIFDV